MPKLTAIFCEICGAKEATTGATSALWGRLKKDGWKKGPRPLTYYCPAERCQDVWRYVMEKAQAGRKGKV